MNFKASTVDRGTLDTWKKTRPYDRPSKLSTTLAVPESRKACRVSRKVSHMARRLRGIVGFVVRRGLRWALVQRQHYLRKHWIKANETLDLGD